MPFFFKKTGLKVMYIHTFGVALRISTDADMDIVDQTLLLLGFLANGRKEDSVVLSLGMLHLLIMLSLMYCLGKS